MVYMLLKLIQFEDAERKKLWECFLLLRHNNGPSGASTDYKHL